jgi:hypothetical protein
VNLRSVDRIVSTLLYEGYILYPYRGSSVKNQLRFNFGVVYPRQYSEAQTGNDAWVMQTQCLASGHASTSIEICVRFLRIVDRVVGRGGASDLEPFQPLRSLSVEGQIHESWQEAIECRVDLPARSLGSLSAEPLQHEFSLPQESDLEILVDAQGNVAGAIVRTREAVHGLVEASGESIGDDAWRVTVRIVNTTGLPSGSDPNREKALLFSLISAHTVLEIKEGDFVSLLEPRADLRDAASQCRNEGTWPVLVGEPGQRDIVLSSPIILYDYPSIAPESPGDLFDATEIDEILTLRVLTMSDNEKDQARRVDERARRILERAESLNPDQFSQLHGTFRGIQGAS